MEMMLLTPVVFRLVTVQGGEATQTEGVMLTFPKVPAAKLPDDDGPVLINSISQDEELKRQTALKLPISLDWLATSDQSPDDQCR